MSVDHVFHCGDHPDPKRLLMLWAEYINQKEKERTRYGDDDSFDVTADS